MKLLVLALMLAALQSDTTALVEAAKEAKAKRKTSTSKVITNADVKKSKGKVTQRPGSTAPDVKPEPTLLEKQAADRAALLVIETKRAELEKTIAALAPEVAALEQKYYETDDLDQRDKVVAPKFADMKAKLDAAKKELDALPPKR
jgi:hypothetical protein